MSLSSWCTTAIGVSAPATCMCTQQKDTEVREALLLCYNFTPTLLLENLKWHRDLMTIPLTSDCDLCWPFWGTIKYTLFHCLHLLSMCHFALTKHISDQVKDLRLVPLPDFHAILHGHDEILGPVFSSMLWALLCCSCVPENIQCSSGTNTHKITSHWIWTGGSKLQVSLHMIAPDTELYTLLPML